MKYILSLIIILTSLCLVSCGKTTVPNYTVELSSQEPVTVADETVFKKYREVIEKQIACINKRDWNTLVDLYTDRELMLYLLMKIQKATEWHILSMQI